MAENPSLRGTSRLLVLAGLMIGLALAMPDTTQATSFHEIRKLTVSDAQAGDVFGLDVAMSGDTAIVGASGDGEHGLFAGAAYVFQSDDDGAGTWTEVKKLTASDAQSSYRFGRSVAVSGDTAVVGSKQENATGFGAGAAYVFRRDEGGVDNWGEVAKLTASDIEAANRFADSVAVSGDTVLVGAPEEQAGRPCCPEGAAYVFERDAGGLANWGLVKKLTASDAMGGARFGWSVAVSDGTVFVGSVVGNAAYMFERDEGGEHNWGEVAKLTASDAEAEDAFGTSMAVSDDIAIVGASLERAGGKWAGAAYVFQRNEGGADNWGEVKKLTASDAEARDNFGMDVALNGDTVVVGASGVDVEGRDTGAAYVLQRDHGGADNWGEVAKLTASDGQALDYFGRNVAVNGDTVLVGAAGDDGEFGGCCTGAAYVFDLLNPKPTATTTPTATITPTPTLTPTPTITPTPTRTLPPGVGGISLDSDLQTLPLETANRGSSAWAAAIGVFAAAFLLALGSAAWYARKRIRARN